MQYAAVARWNVQIDDRGCSYVIPDFVTKYDARCWRSNKDEARQVKTKKRKRNIYFHFLYLSYLLSQFLYLSKSPSHTSFTSYLPYLSSHRLHFYYLSPSQFYHSPHCISRTVTFCLNSSPLSLPAQSTEQPTCSSAGPDAQWTFHKTFSMCLSSRGIIRSFHKTSVLADFVVTKRYILPWFPRLEVRFWLPYLHVFLWVSQLHILVSSM